MRQKAPVESTIEQPSGREQMSGPLAPICCSPWRVDFSIARLGAVAGATPRCGSARPGAAERRCPYKGLE